jgi:hypothetical protein
VQRTMPISYLEVAVDSGANLLLLSSWSIALVTPIDPSYNSRTLVFCAYVRLCILCVFLSTVPAVFSLLLLHGTTEKQVLEKKFCPINARQRFHEIHDHDTVP